MVLAWGYFIWTGSINTIWPLFGIANQLLASVALAVGTTILINIGRAKYAWVTFLPLCFVSVTTLTAGYMSMRDNFWPLAVGAEPGSARPGLRRLDLHGHHDDLLRDHPRLRDAALDAGPLGPGADAGVGRGVSRYSGRANSTFRPRRGNSLPGRPRQRAGFA